MASFSSSIVGFVVLSDVVIAEGGRGSDAWVAVCDFMILFRSDHYVCVCFSLLCMDSNEHNQ